MPDSNRRTLNRSISVGKSVDRLTQLFAQIIYFNMWHFIRKKNGTITEKCHCKMKSWNHWTHTQRQREIAGKKQPRNIGTKVFLWLGFDWDDGKKCTHLFAQILRSVYCSAPRSRLHRLHEQFSEVLFLFAFDTYRIRQTCTRSAFSPKQTDWMPNHERRHTEMFNWNVCGYDDCVARYRLPNNDAKRMFKTTEMDFSATAAPEWRRETARANVWNSHANGHRIELECRLKIR